MALYFALNKPRGYVTARKDEQSQTVMSFLPGQLASGLHPVGRLDKDTEGLLLLTDDGELDAFLLRPESHVEKTYLFMAFGRIGIEKLNEAAEGITLPGNGQRTAPGRCRIFSYLTIKDCAAYLPEDRKEHYMKNPSRPVTVGEIIIHEGHKHQVRLMVKAAGGHVFYLRRTALGRLPLPFDLPLGQYRELNLNDLCLLGYVPGAHSTMRKFEIYEQSGQKRILRGTLYYGKTLTYLPEKLPADFVSVLEGELRSPIIAADGIPSLQNRIRQGDRFRTYYQQEIQLPGDACILCRCGRVSAVQAEEEIRQILEKKKDKFQCNKKETEI